MQSGTANYSGGAVLRIKGVGLISFLKHLAKACIVGRAAGQHSIAEIQQHYLKAITEETALAYAHQSNAYYTSSRGRNVGEDEMVALVHAGKIVLRPSAAESVDPAAYARRLIGDLEAIKAEYRMSEDDPDGYGIGTLHSLSRKLEPFTLLPGNDEGAVRP